MAGELERGASDSATDIEGAHVLRQRGDIEQFFNQTRGEVERVSRSAGPRKDFFRAAVMEEQVFPDQPVALVNVLRHARAAYLSRLSM